MITVDNGKSVITLRIIQQSHTTNKGCTLRARMDGTGIILKGRGRKFCDAMDALVQEAFFFMEHNSTTEDK